MWFFLLLLGGYVLYAYKKYSHLFSFNTSVLFDQSLLKQKKTDQTVQLSQKAKQYEQAHLYSEASTYYRQLLLKTQNPNDAYNLCKLLTRTGKWEEVHEISQIFQYDSRMLHLYFHSVVMLNKKEMPGIDVEYKHHPLHPQFDTQEIKAAVSRWPVASLSKLKLPINTLFEMVCQKPSRLRMQMFCHYVLEATADVYHHIKDLPHPDWLDINSASDLYQFANINTLLLKRSFLITCTECHHKLATTELICHYCGAVESFSEIPHVDKTIIGAQV